MHITSFMRVQTSIQIVKRPDLSITPGLLSHTLRSDLCSKVLFLFLHLSYHAEGFLAVAPVEVLLSCGHMRSMFLPPAQQETSRYLRGRPPAHLRGSILSNPNRGGATSLLLLFTLATPDEHLLYL